MIFFGLWGNLFDSRVTIKFVKKLKVALFLLSLVSFGVFTLFSYTVAKEAWQQMDFDTTVKLQDNISRKYDGYFSYFSLVGSAEVTIGIALVLAALALIKWKLLAVVGWLAILPASFFEVFGKLVIYHPAPPVLFHRNVLETNLPSFYVQTNFSYPSGHMTRTIFLLTVFLVLIMFSKWNSLVKLLLIIIILGFGFMMMLTRIYLGEHWLSDVVGGTFLGICAGLFSASLIISRKVLKFR